MPQIKLKKFTDRQIIIGLTAQNLELVIQMDDMTRLNEHLEKKIALLEESLEKVH